MNLDKARNIAWKNLAAIVVLVLVLFGVSESVAKKYAPEVAKVIESAVAKDEAIGSKKVEFVYDGDTFTLSGGQKVRLIGINAPEMGERHSTSSKELLAKLVLGKEVRLESDVSDVDKYDRLLRYVYVGDVFVNYEIVKEGLAEARKYYPDTRRTEELNEAQNHAKLNKLGIWKEN